MNELPRQLRQLLGALPPASEIGQRMRAAGVRSEDVRTLQDLARIPVLRKDQLAEVQRAPGGVEAMLPCGGLRRVARIFHSPGGILDFEPREGSYWRSRRALESAGIGEGDVVLNTFSYHMTPAARLMEEGLLALGASIVPAGPGQLEMQLDIMRRLDVQAYVGVPSFLSMILDAIVERKLDWARDFRLRTAVLGAEQLSAAARRRFVEEFGIRAFTFYATADAGVIAYECECHDGWHLDEETVVQICDPDSGAPLADGARGEVVVTLSRDFYPLVRFGTGDLSHLVGAPCACGSAAPRLMGVLGRISPAVKVRGLFVYPASAGEIALAHSWIETVRIRVERLGENDVMKVLVLPKPGAAVPADIEPLERTIREVTKLRGAVEIVDAPTFRQSTSTIEDARRWD